MSHIGKRQTSLVVHSMPSGQTASAVLHSGAQWVAGSMHVPAKHDSSGSSHIADWHGAIELSGLKTHTVNTLPVSVSGQLSPPPQGGPQNS